MAQNGNYCLNEVGNSQFFVFQNKSRTSATFSCNLPLKTPEEAKHAHLCLSWCHCLPAPPSLSKSYQVSWSNFCLWSIAITLLNIYYTYLYVIFTLIYFAHLFMFLNSSSVPCVSKKKSQLSEESDCSSNSAACKSVFSASEKSQFLTYKDLCLDDSLNWHNSKVPRFLFFLHAPTGCEVKGWNFGCGRDATSHLTRSLFGHSNGGVGSWVHVTDSPLSTTHLLGPFSLDSMLRTRKIKTHPSFRDVEQRERNGKISR